MRTQNFESGRSRTSSYTSPKAFLPKQPQILHNYKALSNEKLFHKSNMLRENDPPKLKLSPNSFFFDNERISPKVTNEILEINEDFLEFQEKNALNSDDFINNSTFQQNLQASKAYINAMKALQTRNKQLEDEKKELEIQKLKEKEAFEMKTKEYEAILKEKMMVFKNLEGNLKEKLLVLEEEIQDLLNRNKLMENEQALNREEKEKQQDNYNRSLRECLGEKNELKAFLKISEDKIQYLKQENENFREEFSNCVIVKQNHEKNLMNYQEKVTDLQEALKMRTVEFENEREKNNEKSKNSEDYYEKLIEQELNEKQDIYRALNELRGEFERLTGSYQEIQQNFTEKEKENMLMQEKMESIMNEKEQMKQFAEYTQEMNEKLINNFINESVNNINNSSKNLTPITKQKINDYLKKSPEYLNKSPEYIMRKTPEYINKSPEYIMRKSPEYMKKSSEFVKKSSEFVKKNSDNSKEKLFTLENQDKTGEYPSFRNRKSQYKAEYEATVRAIAEMEMDLKDLIEKYRQMSRRIVLKKIFDFYGFSCFFSRFFLLFF